MNISNEPDANLQVWTMTPRFVTPAASDVGALDVLPAGASPAPGSTIDPASCSQLEREFLARMHAIMEAHLGKSGFTIARLAKLLGRSPRQLQRDVVRLTGRCPRDIWRTHRMLQAQHLLSTRKSRSVAEVADRVGMTTSHFSRTYTGWAGHPPSEELNK